MKRMKIQGIEFKHNSLYRVIMEFLRDLHISLVFSEKDHSAYPTCKILQVSILKFDLHLKELRSRRDGLISSHRAADSVIRDSA